MMRRRSITNDLGVLALALVAGACAGTSAEERLDPLGLVPPPPTITAAAASEHVGDLVAVETGVVSARMDRGRAVLVPRGQEEGGLTIVIAPPVVGPSARELVELYAGQEVRAVGYISDLGDDLELLIGDPDRIRILGGGVAAVASSSAGGSGGGAAGDAAPAAPEAPPSAVAGGGAASRAPAVPVVPADPPSGEHSDPACAAAERAWQQAADAARGPLDELQRCLAGGMPGCASAASRVRAALGEIAAAEERVRWVCGVRP